MFKQTEVCSSEDSGFKYRKNPTTTMCFCHKSIIMILRYFVIIFPFQDYTYLRLAVYEWPGYYFAKMIIHASSPSDIHPSYYFLDLRSQDWSVFLGSFSWSQSSQIFCETHKMNAVLIFSCCCRFFFTSLFWVRVLTVKTNNFLTLSSNGRPGTLIQSLLTMTR